MSHFFDDIPASTHQVNPDRMGRPVPGSRCRRLGMTGRGFLRSVVRVFLGDENERAVGSAIVHGFDYCVCFV
jgi:hypothetical protein